MQSLYKTIVKLLEYAPYVPMNLAAEGLDMRSSSRETVVGMLEAISRYDPLTAYNGYNDP